MDKTKKQPSRELKSAGTDIVSNQNKSFKSNANNISNINDYSALKSEKSKSSIDLSKVQYKNGTICKDASNPNPGYGLWCINISPPKEESIFGEGANSTMERMLSTNDHLIDEVNKSLIDKLKFRCDELEKQLATALTNYYERQNKCLNSEKMIEEYEELVNEYIQKNQDLTLENQKLMGNISNLTNALSNAQNEITRLNKIIAGNQDYVKQLNIEFEKKMMDEKRIQESLEKSIKKMEEQIDFLVMKQEDKNSKKSKRYSIANSAAPGTGKMEFQMRSLQDINLELSLENKSLKEKLNSLMRDKYALKDIIKFKDKKNNYQQQNIESLFSIMEEKDRNEQWNKVMLREKEGVIQILKNQNKDLLLKAGSRSIKNEEITKDK
ncbi:MAG: hypothetical protein MJ252_08130 [archaeon]|nr:hypothetical protein [archaeon]